MGSTGKSSNYQQLPPLPIPQSGKTYDKKLMTQDSGNSTHRLVVPLAGLSKLIR